MNSVQSIRPSQRVSAGMNILFDEDLIFTLSMIHRIRMVAHNIEIKCTMTLNESILFHSHYFFNVYYNKCLMRKDDFSENSRGIKHHFNCFILFHNALTSQVDMQEIVSIYFNCFYSISIVFRTQNWSKLSFECRSNVKQ